MDRTFELISIAGNTEAPAYLSILSKGYSVEAKASNNEALYSAKSGAVIFKANSMIELLGLISMREIRGASWIASDHEIDVFLCATNLDEAESL